MLVDDDIMLGLDFLCVGLEFFITFCDLASVDDWGELLVCFGERDGWDETIVLVSRGLFLLERLAEIVLECSCGASSLTVGNEIKSRE